MSTIKDLFPFEVVFKTYLNTIEEDIWIFKRRFLYSNNESCRINSNNFNKYEIRNTSPMGNYLVNHSQFDFMKINRCVTKPIAIVYPRVDYIHIYNYVKSSPSFN